jgi:hypothetical protein
MILKHIILNHKELKNEFEKEGLKLKTINAMIDPKLKELRKVVIVIYLFTSTYSLSISSSFIPFPPTFFPFPPYLSHVYSEL